MTDSIGERFSAAARRSTRSLRVRNFRNYFIGQTLSTAGTGMQMLAQTWLVLELGASASKLGLLISLMTLPVLVLGPWAGAIADRVDNRLVITCTSVGAGLTALAIGILTSTDHASIPVIYGLATLMGVIQAFDRPAGQALLYELVGPDDLPSAVGLNGMQNATTRLMGPGLAALAIAQWGIAACFYANAVSFLAVVVAIGGIRRSEMYPRHAGRARARIVDGIRYAWHRPVLRQGLLGMAVVGTMAYNFALTVPSMIKFVYGGGATALGVAQVVSGVGSVTGGLIAASVVESTTRKVAVATLAFGTAILAGTLSPTLLVFVIIWLPGGAASAIYTSTTQALLQQHAEPEYQGRVMALFSMAWMGSTPIGASLLGWVIDTWDARVAFGVGAVSTLLTGALLLSRHSGSHSLASV